MTNGLEKTLTLPDLVLFGITSILGSGGFNLVGSAIKDGGHFFPLALLASGALFLGSANSYSYAREQFSKNISETLLIEKSFGTIGKNLSVISILTYNIFAIALILVFTSQILFPKANYVGQVGFSLLLLVIMSLAAFQRLEVNKEVIDGISIGIIFLLSFASVLGIGGLMTQEFEFPKIPAKVNLYESFLYFFFVLAGHDTLIKFTEESNDKKDIDKSMYISIIISIILVAGVSLAAIVWVHDFRRENVDDIVADIFQAVFHNGVSKIVTILAIVFMLSSNFLGFLGTIRYLYGIPEDYKGLEFLRIGGDGKVSNTSIILVTIASLFAILIHQKTSLVEIADIGLISVLLLVSLSSFIDKYKNKKICFMDGLTATGFLGVLGLTINKHFL
jgi:hypothetical protein